MVTNTLAPSQQKSILPTKVRFIPELNTVSLPHNRVTRDRELLLWYILKYLDKSGQGWLDYDNTIQALISDFGYPRRTLMRVLRLGEGIFWNRYIAGRSTIKIQGIKNVCEYLGTYKLSRVEVDIKDIPKGLKARRGFLFNTGAHKPMWGTDRVDPISRKSLEEKTGINPRQQRRYDETAKTIKEETKAKRRDPKTHKLYAVKHKVKTTKGIMELPKLLGNRYYSFASKAPIGQLKKLGKTVRDSIGSLVIAEARNKLAKCYYTSFSDYVVDFCKGKAPGEGCYYPTKSNRGYVECLPMLNS